MSLTAIVIGTGWAGEGHSRALQTAGVELLGVCGRSPESAHALAAKFGAVPAFTDWQAAITNLQPNIVAIATLAPFHAEVVQFAAQHGCHILCEKPLALDAPTAKSMLDMVEVAGIKHAYASTGHYLPQIEYASQLLAEGAVGSLHSIEVVNHYGTSPKLAYSWFHQLALGGGALYTNFPHQLAQAMALTQGRPQAARGHTRRLIEQAPVAGPQHDFRQLPSLTDEQAAQAEWREVDADMEYTLSLELNLPDGNTAQAYFHCSELGRSAQPNHITLNGTGGTLIIENLREIKLFSPATEEWQELSVPDDLMSKFDDNPNRTQTAWNQLAAALVAHINGIQSDPYPTFYEGWLTNQICDIARQGNAWTPLQTR